MRGYCGTARRPYAIVVVFVVLVVVVAAAAAVVVAMVTCPVCAGARVPDVRGTGSRGVPGSVDGSAGGAAVPTAVVVSVVVPALRLALVLAVLVLVLQALVLVVRMVRMTVVAITWSGTRNPPLQHTKTKPYRSMDGKRVREMPRFPERVAPTPTVPSLR